MEYSLEQCDGSGVWCELDCAGNFLEARERGWGLIAATSSLCTRIRSGGAIELNRMRREICPGCTERPRDH